MFLWNDMNGVNASYTTIEEEKAKEEETVKKYLSNMQAETESKCNNSDRNSKQGLFKLLKAIELIGRYL